MGCAEEPRTTIGYADEPHTTIGCVEEPDTTICCAEEPRTTIGCADEPHTTIGYVEEPVTTIGCSTEPHTTIGCAEEPHTTICCSDKPDTTIGCSEELVTTNGCSEEPHTIIGCAEEQMKDQKKKKKKKWSFKKGKKGTKVTPVSLTILCSEEPVSTISHSEQASAHDIGRPEQVSALNIGCPFRSCRKVEEEHVIQRTTINRTVLGFSNLGNTCYMNAALQSLFSLTIFTHDIRDKEGCWRSNLPTSLLKCLTDLHSARASPSHQRKISLLKTLKQTITANFSDFCGDEQQDAHEFLGVLLSQLKDEGLSMRTRVGLHPDASTIVANFEFELLSTRTCLSCGEKVCRTEPSNCLSVDLVARGSIEDSLALYFKGFEVECKCQWCSGQLASVEQRFQSLPRMSIESPACSPTLDRI
ncbi:ubiquitin carboxyl-terminal hydrolase 29-like [Conger conger]|uniref:ubiquitin carboxyl-terminal hydrolase 29-like n=1 Tax=Conger conger TaxID=82655 RepID=UPI002A5ACB16|nr:ubiquitin carboxyl-terminal hydrolase 29-like [Conger conger]